MPELLLIPAVCAADLYIKEKIEQAEDLPRTFWKGRIRIRRSHNHGFAMNRHDDSPQAVRRICTGASLLAAAGTAAVWKDLSACQRAGFSLALGGAAGNVADRWIRGYVVDYMNYPKVKRIRQIDYNLSDLSIFAGVLLGLLG